MSGEVVAARRRLAALSAPEATRFLAPSLMAWRRWMVAIVALGFFYPFVLANLGLTEIFFFTQDLPAAMLMLALGYALYLTPPAWAPAKARPPGWRAAALLSLAVAAICWAGSRIVYDGYALALDEFMARFDARILASGHLLAEIPAAWRPYAAALQPNFIRISPDGAHWASQYLPVNAAFLALAAKLGAMSLMTPLWAGIAVVATYGAGRRLWPERPNAAWAAALLLATTPQLLITAMTPYAMSAHLALNMVWLWLVLRGGRLGHGAAAGVAFLATGLHQLIFNPLFAAPFVAEMWLAKRWRPALWHTFAYAAIGLFWAAWPGLAAQTVASAIPRAGAAAVAAGGAPAVAAHALDLLRKFQPIAATGFMIENLARFLSWQSLLAMPLALLAVRPALKQGGAPRALVMGVILTTLAAFALMPYQGHGWGYRYLHGLMGALCLLAGLSWSRISERADPRARAAVFGAAAAASLIVLFPFLAWRTWATTHPHAAAMRQIRAIPADVLVVQDNTLRIDIMSVRNDPWLTNRPLLMFAENLTAPQVRELCARYRVRWLIDDPAGPLTENRCPTPAVTAAPGPT